jgi:hypothetical protein
LKQSEATDSIKVFYNLMLIFSGPGCVILLILCSKSSGDTIGGEIAGCVKLQSTPTKFTQSAIVEGIGSGHHLSVFFTAFFY